jgi:excinuclease ABC subunit C
MVLSSPFKKSLILLDRIYPFRKCDKMPDKLCLYYHIGQCMGPCVYEFYLLHLKSHLFHESFVHRLVDLHHKHMVPYIVRYGNGEDKTILKNLEDRMMDASEKLDFERAKEYRDLILFHSHPSYDPLNF